MKTGDLLALGLVAGLTVALLRRAQAAAPPPPALPAPPTTLSVEDCVRGCPQISQNYPSDPTCPTCAVPAVMVRAPDPRCVQACKGGAPGPDPRSWKWATENVMRTPPSQLSTEEVKCRSRCPKVSSESVAKLDACFGPSPSWAQRRRCERSVGLSPGVLERREECIMACQTTAVAPKPSIPEAVGLFHAFAEPLFG